MEHFVPVLRDICLVIGAAAILTGSIGVIRFPDFYSRVHAAGLSETGGLGFIFAGLLIEAGFTLVSAKLLIILLFMVLTGPTASHALAKTAVHGGLVPLSHKAGESKSN